MFKRGARVKCRLQHIYAHQPLGVSKRQLPQRHNLKILSDVGFLGPPGKFYCRIVYLKVFSSRLRKAGVGLIKKREQNGDNNKGNIVQPSVTSRQFRHLLAIILTQHYSFAPTSHSICITNSSNHGQSLFICIHLNNMSSSFQFRQKYRDNYYGSCWKTRQ